MRVNRRKRKPYGCSSEEASTNRHKYEDGVTPLHRAAWQGDIDRVRELIDADVPLEEKMQLVDGRTDCSFGTALHWVAIEENHYTIAKYPLNVGADINALDSRGTPLKFAQGFGSDRRQIVELLASRGARR